MTPDGRQIVFWKRLDLPGLERLELRRSAESIAASGTLTPSWSVVSVEVTKAGPLGEQRLQLERQGDGWLVDGTARPDLDGAAEPDLSVTPWCNTLPIRSLADPEGSSTTLDTCYIDGATMTVVRSRQRYERLGPRRVRYVDLGTAAGFEAVIDVDDEGLTTEYEGLFRRVGSGSTAD